VIMKPTRKHRGEANRAHHGDLVASFADRHRPVFAETSAITITTIPDDQFT